MAERIAVGTAAGATAVVVGVPVAKEAFRRGGWLNNNPYFRIGWNWKGTKAAGKDVFRIAIGNRKAPIWWHIDLWPFW